MNLDTPATPAKQGFVPMTIGALLGIMALLAYLFVGSRNETLEVQKLLTTKVEQFATVQLRLDSVATVLDAKIVEVRQLGGNVAKLERLRRQLETDKRQLKSDFAFSVQQYDLKINDYRQFLAANEVDIQRLRAENGSLRNQAKRLEAENQTILSENAGLKTEKAILAQTVVDYSEENKDLRDKVTRASALKAVNVEVLALSSNGKERSGGSYRASRIDRLKITFMLPTNPVSAKADKDIFVRLLDPNGAVLSDSGIGGVTWVGERELGYSFRQAVFFENNDQTVAFSFRREAPYKPGTYTVELYADGFPIGSGQFTIR